ncbi:hypothetical protein INR49_029836 [Caranx melampygus]|nr:hypothetical protein INR49_029836 [Caranx melampygus]
MTAEWLHLPPPYPPGVGPLCGAELEAWYEDLQDILGSDTGGAKLARAPTCTEKEPEFLDVLESGVGMVDASGAVISGGYYYHHHQHHQANNVHPASPSASEEELPCVPDSPSCSSSASQSPSQNCSSPSSPVSSPSVYPSSRLGKRKRTTSERTNGALSSFASSTQHTSSSYSSAKKSRKEREQENERKVQELTEQNERLKAEIERLGEEVQRTRRALIERLQQEQQEQQELEQRQAGCWQRSELSSEGRTHSADAVACLQRADKGASALQHGNDARLRGIELIPDGLADRWHTRNLSMVSHELG